MSMRSHQPHGGAPNQGVAPPVGIITALVTFGLAVGMVLMPIKYRRTFGKLLLIVFALLPLYLLVDLGESSLFNHPILCIPLMFAAFWLADDMRAQDKERTRQRQAENAARYHAKATSQKGEGK